MTKKRKAKAEPDSQDFQPKRKAIKQDVDRGIDSAARAFKAGMEAADAIWNIVDSFRGL